MPRSDPKAQSNTNPTSTFATACHIGILLYEGMKYIFTDEPRHIKYRESLKQAQQQESNIGQEQHVKPRGSESGGVAISRGQRSEAWARIKAVPSDYTDPRMVDSSGERVTGYQEGGRHVRWGPVHTQQFEHQHGTNGVEAEYGPAYTARKRESNTSYHQVYNVDDAERRHCYTVKSGVQMNNSKYRRIYKPFEKEYGVRTPNRAMVEYEILDSTFDYRF